MQEIDPGHAYDVHNKEDTKVMQRIVFIKKEAKDGKLSLVHDGTTTEEVLWVISRRLTNLYGILPDPFTKTALWHVNQAMGILALRTRDRRDRGVEGTPNE